MEDNAFVQIDDWARAQAMAEALDPARLHTAFERLRQQVIPFAKNHPQVRGAEKGYIQFGGSSTITIFEPGKVTLAEDLARHSAGMVELYARVGDVMATAVASE